MVTERDGLLASLAHVRGTATPRPEWSRCEGYVEDWSQVSHGRSSEQLVDVLLARISGKTVEELTALSTFPGQVGGVGEGREGCARWGVWVRGGRGVAGGMLGHAVCSSPGLRGGCASLPALGGAGSQSQVLSETSQHAHHWVLETHTDL